jgi:hypothetical protein
MNWKKISSIIGAILLISAFAGAIIGFENRYVTKDEVNAKEINVVETLREFQIEQQQRSETFELKTDYKFYKFIYDDLTEKIEKYRRDIKKNPDDLFIQEEYKDLIERRREIRKKMDSILEKIK